MPGIDPALLANIGGNAAPPAYAGGAAPGSAGAAAPATDDGDHAEPVALHNACMELMETMLSASQMAQDLSAQAELAEDIDAKAEKSIGKAAQLIQQAADIMADVEKSLGEARSAHEDAMDSGDNPGEPPA